jgi:hypothetical protein
MSAAVSETRSDVEVLRAARERLSVRAHWVKGVLSDTLKFGDDQDALREGSCWCLSGAIGCEAERGQWDKCVAIVSGVVGKPVIDFNDGATHAEVLGALDKAIELVEAQG